MLAAAHRVLPCKTPGTVEELNSVEVPDLLCHWCIKSIQALKRLARIFE